jgi:KUP system potassium uptake protein
MASSTSGVPVVLLHHLKHNKVLHEQVILMSVLTEEIPEIRHEERVRVERFALGFYRVTARYGFMETPNVPQVLEHAGAWGITAKPNDTTYYLGRDRVIIAGREHHPGARRSPDQAGASRMTRWRKKLFVVMSRNARSATEFFGIPPNRVVELGAQVEL